MNKLPPDTSTKPAYNDSHPARILFGIASAQALLVAHDLCLFELLAKNPLTITEICTHLHITPRAAQALLSMCTSQNLLTFNQNEQFELTETARNYLLQESPTYFGNVLDNAIQNYDIFTFQSLHKAITTDCPQIYRGKDLFLTNEKKEDLAKSFTRSMHSKSIAAAMYWPDRIHPSLSGIMLDIGGGSGAHSICAVKAHPHLEAIIFDRPVVCDVADEFITQYGLEKRIRTFSGDIFKDDFPDVDYHFFSDILHDWPMDKCLLLASKSYKSLPPGGKIIIHEMLFNDQKTGPFTVAAYNINMQLWTSGQQFSGREIKELLGKAGFANIEIHATGYGEWHIVIGEKR